MLGRWLEITFMLILVYLVLSRATGFSSAISSLSSFYVEGVKALQGRS
jgi:hypothetical protein